MTADHASRNTDDRAHQHHREGQHENRTDHPPIAHPPTHVEDDPSGTAAPAIPEPRWASQISPESRAYWEPLCAAMEPMSREDLADIVTILRRIDTRRATRAHRE